MIFPGDFRPDSASVKRTAVEEVAFSANRPQSRRGLREYPGNLQSASTRSSSMRPSSAYRGGTASRLGTSTFGPMPAPPTAAHAGRVGTAVAGLSIIDRPITQQGLSGLRTGTARGYRNRQLQDKRYWEEILQGKIRELRTEIGRLNEKSDANEREKSANKHYEKRVKDLAKELTDLQGRLSDYNTAIRISTGATSKMAVLSQMKELESSNAALHADLERVFVERQRKEVQLQQVNDQMQKEHSVLEKLISKMNPIQKEEYTRLNESLSALKEEAEHMRGQIDQANTEKETLTKEMSMSQLKVHMVELYRRLATIEEKRSSLQNDINNKLQPHEEREKLLQQVREDNAAIASMEKNAASVKDQVKKVQESIEQAEQDLEEGQSERHQKYRELRKREETMEAFMSTYEESSQRELDKIESIEKDIVFALEHSSANSDMNLDEIDNLKQSASLFSVDNEANKTVEGLTREYERLKANLKKIESTKERLTAQLQTLPEKTAAMKAELETLTDLDRLRAEVPTFQLSKSFLGAERKIDLENELKSVKDKLTPTENAVKEASNKLRELQKSLDGNEMYTKLNNLEEKLSELENSKTVLVEDIGSITNKEDYEPIKREVLQNLAELNKKLIEDLNIKSY